ANVEAIRTKFSKTSLRAPIAGVVTRQDAKPGEIAAANTALVSLLSLQGFEIEANVPEVDIGKIRPGNSVAITLDAFPSDGLSGHVARIDPAETIVDGVVNYKVTVVFEHTDPRLRSGLTANLEVKTVEKPDALVLPQVAIIENDRGTFVKKIEGSASREVPVAVGIRGQDGNVEITSGLVEGDRVENVGRRNANTR
ncbi:MAG: efflux RND transporter periplasmic adaptor subunit, partial [bacterium]|nr:efflux RND transporter periplasmic adaptor subunit [bacterium]